jgi:hypothetical protein
MMIMALYLYLLVILVALACWRTVMAFSLVTLSIHEPGADLRVH